MMSPVKMNPIIIIQRFSVKHSGVDIRDAENQKLLNHRAMERSRVTAIGFGKTFGEPFIELQGLDTGVTYLYCHNTPLVSVGDEVSEGIDIGRPSVIGTWGDKEGKKKFHLHLSIVKEGRRIDPIPFFDEHGIAHGEA